MKFSNTFAFMISVGFCCAGVSGSAVAQTPDASGENLQQRVLQLETQMEAIRAELTELKSALGGDANTTVVAEKKPVESTGAPSSSPQRKEQAMEKHATGIDLGPVRAVPYGTIYFNAFGNSGGTNNADDPLFATPTNQGNTSMSVRQTRLGLKLEGPTVLQAKSRGQIEADFFGGFPAIGVGDNFGIVRLRLAFARLDWEKTSLEAGQDWMVFAPNNPVSIAAAAIPQMAAAGNPWARLP